MTATSPTCSSNMMSRATMARSDGLTGVPVGVDPFGSLMISPTVVLTSGSTP